MDSYYSSTTKPLFRASQVVWSVVSVIEALLVTRLLLRLLAANPNAGFTDFIYTLTRPFTLPFRSVFVSSAVEGNVLEWSTLLAMLVYWIVGLGILQFLSMSRSVTRVEAAKELGRHSQHPEAEVVTTVMDNR